MSSWGKYDNAANTPLWAVNASIVKNNPTKAAPTRANVTLLYANTTSGAYIAGETVGLFGVDAQEANANKKVAHAGWVLKTTGTGGRAGRVQQETLVALSSMNGTDGDGQIYANVSISLAGPSAASVLASGSYANTATFTVTPTLSGNTSATLTYAWQTNNATGTRGWTTPTDIANIHFTGVTTATLGVKPANTANTTDVFRVVVTAADQGVVATSSNATITIA
jgi:hypothetical protein